MEQLAKQRHSLAHIMVQAQQRLIDPDMKLGVGPVVENGYYHDFVRSEKADQEIIKSEADIFKITNKEMQRIVKENQDFIFIDMDSKWTIEILTMLDQQYTLELGNDLIKKGEKTLGVYVNTINSAAAERILTHTKPEYLEKYKKVSNWFVDHYPDLFEGKFVTFVNMCKGPHVENTKEIPADSFSLEKVAGAYWKGDATNNMMTRIYGLVFSNKQELKEYKTMMEEARKRDHKILGKKFDLFSFSEYGPGFPFFHNNGMIIINELQKYWRETHTRDGYEEIKTPIMLNKELREVSGHRGHYKENMYITNIDEQDFAIKPMNCPGGMLVYKTTPKSYRDLPLKAGEFGQVHRHELSGTLNGLFRVRTFTQDDAHIFCTEKQFKQEIKNVIDLIFEMYARFGFEKVNIELSTRPDKYVGDLADRDLAEDNLKQALTEKNIDYVLNEGDGAFYGPKIDFKILDAIGREWQCGTVQLDFALPKRFELEYIGEDGQKHTPIMLHRVVYGSLERFFGILIEHFAGAFPLWLAPTQIRIVPVADKFKKYASELRSKMMDLGLRVDVDDSEDSFSKKIRNGDIAKIPYLVVVGEKEETTNNLSIREYKTKDQYELSVEDFIKKCKEEYKSRSI